jgi:hypothetical protein
MPFPRNMQREYLGYVFLALLYEENMSENCCKITPEEIALIGSIIVIVFLITLMITMSR